jgi:hypothetical protein
MNTIRKQKVAAAVQKKEAFEERGEGKKRLTLNERMRKSSLSVLFTFSLPVPSNNKPFFHTIDKERRER